MNSCLTLLGIHRFVHLLFSFRGFYLLVETDLDVLIALGLALCLNSSVCNAVSAVLGPIWF